MRFVKDSILLYGGFIVKILITLLIDRFLAINLGAHYYGDYKYSITILTILGNIAGLGLSSSIVRKLVLYKSFLQIKYLLQRCFLLLLLLACIIALLFYNERIVKIFSIDKINIYILFTLLGFVLNQFIIGVYSAFKSTNIKVVINEFLNPFILFCFLLVLKKTELLDLNKAFLIYATTTYIILVFNFIGLIKSLKKQKQKPENIKDSDHKLYIKDFVRYAYPIYLTSILVLLAGTIDKLVLVNIVDKVDLGIYYAMFSLSSILNLMLTSLLFLFLPLASNYFGNMKIGEGELFCSYSSKWLMFFAFIPFWLLFYYSKDVIQFFYNQEFVSGNLLLKVLVLAAYINVSAGFTGQTLLAIGDSKRQMIVRIITLALSFGLMYLLGIKFGMIGVAISVFIGLLASNLLQIFVIKFKHKVNLYNIMNLKSLIYIASFSVIRYSIGLFLEINFILSFSIDIVIFIFVGYLIKIVSEKDLDYIKLIEF